MRQDPTMACHNPGSTNPSRGTSRFHRRVLEDSVATYSVPHRNACDDCVAHLLGCVYLHGYA